MRKIALFLMSAGFVSLAGCGCLEKYTDPRFKDDGGPQISADGKSMHPRGPAIEAPDSEQPDWHRCVFGTRWLPTSPGVILGLGDADPNQPAWHRRLFGPRYVELPPRVYRPNSIPPQYFPSPNGPAEPMAPR